MQSRHRQLPRLRRAMLRRSVAHLVVVFSVAGPLAAAAQRTPRPTEKATPPAILNPAYDSSLYSNPGGTSSRFKALAWRLVGPFRGGRVVAVAGDPTKPLVFYFGAVNGGVWKTTNGGQTWRNVTDGKSDISSVGAIAVAVSDPSRSEERRVGKEWRARWGRGPCRNRETWEADCRLDERVGKAR